MAQKLFKKIRIEGTLRLLSGLHIGTGKDQIDIGGMDNPVIRRKDNQQPYIPGSSIKGKMRHLLEISQMEPQSDSTLLDDISAFMGSSNSKKPVASSILVRDAYLTKESAEVLGQLDTTDAPYTEIKHENTIQRETAIANPRNSERVPAGAEFKVEFIINILGENETEAKNAETRNINLLKKGVQLLNQDYLGGSGSRGYGQVLLELNWPGEVLDIKSLNAKYGLA